MAALSIALKDITIDPDRPVDLTALPEAEAIRLIKDSYGFLGPLLDVAIREGVAIITLPDEKAQRVTDALKTFTRALSSARRGDYKRAIGQFHQVLAVLPAHADARRNLAMAYEETGDVQHAKDHIIEALKLNPKDAWSYVLLGNIYVKHDKHPERADRLYRRALELAPDDATLLANYGVLMMHSGSPEQAEEFFERAIAADPGYPNAYYNLAVMEMHEARPEEAIAAIDAMFARSPSPDRRFAPIYAEARRLYLEANRQAAEASAARLMEFVDGRRRALEDQAGYPIDIVEDSSLDVSGVSQMAWKRGWDRHIVRYKTRTPAAAPHLIAHELEHIALEDEARRAGRNRVFVTTPATRDLAERSIGDQIYRLKGMGLSAEQAAQYIQFVLNGLTLQLSSAPLDMIIERRLHDRCEILRPSQLVSLHAIYLEPLPVLTNREIRRHAPLLIYKANLALSSAHALFLDHLYAGKTAFADPYRDCVAFDTGQKLFGLWRDAIDSFQPGDEYTLVDQFATVLRLEHWYEWKPDLPAPPLAFDRGGERLDLPTIDGATNAGLLKEKEPAAVMYCLGALQRFDKMSDDQVREVAFEIAMLGRFGLDYADPEEKYPLKSLPGEKFSGLRLMCLMYVGFQRIDPTLDTGIDLHHAYRAALALHNAGK